MTKEELKQRAVQAVEDAKEELIAAGRALNSMPEPGYREVKTGRFVKEQLEKCGLSVESGLALTGLRAKAVGRKSEDGAAAGKRINVGVMGELDSLIMPQHAGADPVTGAFHGCGHHSQLTTVIGTAIGLVRTGLLRELDGDLTFFAVPAVSISATVSGSDVISTSAVTGRFMPSLKEPVTLRAALWPLAIRESPCHRLVWKSGRWTCHPPHHSCHGCITWSGNGRPQRRPGR